MLKQLNTMIQLPNTYDSVSAIFSINICKNNFITVNKSYTTSP